MTAIASQLKLAAALRLIDGHGGQNETIEETRTARRRLFAAAQVQARLAMLEGGGGKPLAMLMETQTGWLVRLALAPHEARRLAAQLILAAEP